MSIRFLAGGVALLASVCLTPAAAHPYDQYIRSRSFFGALFGPSIARMVVSYPTIQKTGTIVISTAQRRLYLVLGNGQALLCHRRRGRRLRLERHQPGDRQARVAGLDAARGDAAASARSAASYGGRPGQSDGRPRGLSRREPLSHSRFEHACQKPPPRVT